jgi:hypothetical protein
MVQWVSHPSQQQQTMAGLVGREKQQNICHKPKPKIKSLVAIKTG